MPKGYELSRTRLILTACAFVLAAFALTLAAVPAAALEETPESLQVSGDALDDAPLRPRVADDALEIKPEDDPRMEEYSHGGYILFFVGRFWTIAVLLLIVLSGLGSWLQDLAEKVTWRVNLQVGIYGALLATLTFLAALPLNIYRGFLREKQFGFANQSLVEYLGDRGRLFAFGLILQVLFIILLYFAIRRLGRRWWIGGAVLGILFAILIQAIYPVFIAPLVNDFQPLEDAALRADLLSLARAQGIPADEVYQIDASRQSEHSNAYVAGILGTQRIVLYDTMLKRFASREIRAVMGHEMGHYVLNHIWKGIAASALLIALGFFLVDIVARRQISRRPSLGIRSLQDPASLPLLLLLLNIYLLLVTPVIANFSRMLEHDADRFTLDVVRDPAATASAFIKFAQHDLGEYEVHPAIEKLLFTHPALGNRGKI